MGKFKSQRNGYRYSDDGFRLSFLELQEDELISMFLAEDVLRQYQGTPYAADLASACRKIASGMTRVKIEEQNNSHSFRLTAAKPIDFAVHRVLNDAIRTRHCLAIRYYSASRDQELQRDVDPLYIANIDGVFYLIAFCHSRREVRTFNPSRIQSIEPTGAKFEPPPDFQIDVYLADSLTVLRGEEGKLHKVKIRSRASRFATFASGSGTRARSSK